MLFDAAEVDIEIVERGEERAHRRALRHLGEGIDIFRETLSTIAALAIGARNVGVRVVDVARKQNARMNLRPIAAHLLDILLRRVEVRDLVRAEDIVDVLREFRLKRRHHGKPLSREDLDE